MSKKTWVYAPHSGGRSIPDVVQERTRSRILAYAQKHYAGKYTRIEVRFHGHFGYIDAYTEPFVPNDFDEKLMGNHASNILNGYEILLLTYVGSGISEMRTLGLWLFTRTATSDTSLRFSTMEASKAHRRRHSRLRQSICRRRSVEEGRTTGST